MKISDLLNITGGVLDNEPQIRAIESATVYPSKVETGDLFLAECVEEIPAAVERGAYAVVYAGRRPKGMDEEIAWIRVDSVREAAFRLLRYVLLHKGAHCRLMSAHEMSLFKMLRTQKGSVVVLPREWRRAFETILNSSAPLFVGTDRELLETIEPDLSGLDERAEGYLVSDTLFRSTFKLDGFIYQEKELAPFHLDALLKVAAFCRRHQIGYSLDKLRYTPHFRPVFVDTHLRPVVRGSSERVLVFVDNIPDIVNAREYIRHQGHWLKSIVLTPPGTKIEGLDRPLWFESDSRAVEILKSRHFNYAFIYSLDREFLKPLRQDPTLF